jgi:hypothetical protein
VNVKELRDLLEGLPDERPVIISSDEEGNRFNDLVDVNGSGWIRRSEYEVDGVHPDDIGPEYEKSECERAVVLWP